MSSTETAGTSHEILDKYSIFIWDTLNESLYRDADATIVDKIISISWNESVNEMVSACSINIPSPFAPAFLGYPCPKVVKVKKNDEVIWLGRVVSVACNMDNVKNSCAVQCASMTVDLTYATGDSQIYSGQKLEQVLYKQAELILKGAKNGSPTSPLGTEDYCFFVADKARNKTLDKVSRSAGMGISAMIQQLLSMGGLYFWTQMYDGRSRVLVSDNPWLPSGKFGFPQRADELYNAESGERTHLRITVDKDTLVEFSHKNISSYGFNYDSSVYRDRLRILYQRQNNSTGEIPIHNPALAGAEIFQTTKSGAKLPKAPWVPNVIHREYLARDEAQRIASMIWNNTNLYCPSFELTLSSFELDDSSVHVGKKVTLSFKHEMEANAPSSKDKKFFTYELLDTPMVISSAAYTIGGSGVGKTCKITLTDERSFWKEYETRKKPYGTQPLSYYNNYDKKGGTQ